MTAPSTSPPDADATATRTGAAAEPGAPRPPSGKKASLPAALRRKVARFAKEIRDEHGVLDRPTADRLVRLLRTSVVPRRKLGKPTSPEVLKALELRTQGVPWPKVYSSVFPGFWSMSFLERHWHSTKLRDAVRAHRRRKAKAADRPPSPPPKVARQPPKQF